ncbi:hypothetical protein TNCV_1960721 [Trichonephila clavipes]|nr:hypothetical protein TNCV_1960721 [Trichonephila clavipes]
MFVNVIVLLRKGILIIEPSSRKSSREMVDWEERWKVSDHLQDQGLSPLDKLSHTVIGTGLVQLFGDRLQPFMNFIYPNNDGNYQDVNAPFHGAQIIRSCIEEYSRQFQRRFSYLNRKTRMSLNQ